MFSSILTHLWFIALYIDRSNAQTPKGVPLVIPPSGQWDGIDGPWSTFNIGIGDPSQPARCVPGVTDVVLSMTSPYACDRPEYSSNACDHAVLYNNSISNTFKSVGVYTVPTGWGQEFPKDTNFGASMGLDNIAFGQHQVRELGVAQQFIAMISEQPLSVCTFGIAIGNGSSPVSVDTAPVIWFSGRKKSNEEMRPPNLLTYMCTTQAVPSCSFSYTAGSAGKNTSGSLIFGGYDTARFEPSTTVSTPLYNSSSALIVEVSSITAYSRDQNAVAWSSPLKFRIDSSFAGIWMPTEICDIFEKAFNLTWNNATQYYFIDEATRLKLLQDNPSVSFSIGSGSNARNIILPYSAFDLKLEPPLVNTTTNYFPLRRASNPSQYILGRTFLQETYLTVDYGRGNFSISQAYSGGTSGYVVPILNGTTTESTTPDATGSSKSGLSAGAYAGIGVGIAVLILLALAAVLLWRRKRRRQNSARPVSKDRSGEKSELDGAGLSRHEVSNRSPAELADHKHDKKYELVETERGELETVERHAEVEGVDRVHEMWAGPALYPEKALSQR